MAPRKQKSTVQSDETQTTYDAAPSASQDASQDIDDQYRQKLKELDQKNVQARRRNMVDAIRKAHQQRFNQLHDDVRKFEQVHEKRINDIQRPQVEELNRLYKKKLELERKIGVMLGKVEKCQKNTADQLDACLQERVRELRDEIWSRAR